MLMQVIPAGWDSEAFLAQRVLAGDSEAFSQLMKPCERMIYASALSILHNDADVEEVVQEAKLKAFTNLPRFRRESKFSTWMVQITINEARMRRRRYRPHLYDSIDAPVLTAKGRYVLLDFAERRETSFRVLEKREFHRGLCSALDLLPRIYRE